MADHVAVARLGELRALPEGLRQRLEAERGEEPLAGLDHLHRVVAGGDQPLGQVVAGRRRVAGRYQGVDVRPTAAPRGCPAGDPGSAPVAGTTSRAVALGELGPHVAVERLVERPDLAPEPVELGFEGRPAPCRTSSARARRGRRSRARARPRCRARRSAGSRRACRAPRSCASLPTPRAARPGSRLSASRLEISLMSRHGLSPPGHHWPRPYSPSMRAAICVSSERFAASLGAGSVSAILSSLSLRSYGAGSASPSNRVASVRQLHRGRDRRLVGARGEQLGVERDVGGLHPLRAVALDPEVEQPRLGGVEEGLGLLHRGRRVVVRGQRPGQGRGQDQGEGHGSPGGRRAASVGHRIDFLRRELTGGFAVVQRTDSLGCRPTR